MRKRVLSGLGLVALLAALTLAWCVHRGGAEVPRTATRKSGSRIGAAMPHDAAPSAALSGRIVSAANGTPIGSAVVSVAIDRQLFGDGSAPFTAISDGAGRWSASEVPAGTYTLTVTAVGYLPHAGELVLDGAPRTNLDVSLDVGGTIVSGLVATEKHEPIAGARVRAYRDSGAPSFVALSGADGRYQISLATGAFQLEVTHAEYRRAWENVTVDDGPVSADFVLLRGGEIRGQVIARDTNQPVPDAVVTAVGGRDFSTAQAAADGTFTVRGLAPGTITVNARGRGYASVTPTTVEIDVGERQSAVRVIVDPAFSIVGRVVANDDHARGIGGATVLAMNYGSSPMPITTQSDGDGSFELVGVLPGHYVLSADKRGMLFEGGVQVAVTDDDVTDALIEMRSGVTLTGRVEPPTVAQIGLARPGGDLLAETNDKDAVSIAKARTETDAKGAFTLRDVPTGDFEISAMAKDGRSGSVSVTVTGATQPPLVIPLTPRSSIAGRVVDTNGAPVVGVYVFNNRLDAPLATRFRRDGIYRGATTAADGSYKIVGLEAGTWQLSVVDRSSGSDSAKVDIDLVDGRDRNGVTITVDARDAQIRGTVLGTDGKPASGAEVQAVREVQGSNHAGYAVPNGTARTDANGSFTIDKLRRGTYTVFADGPRGASRGTKSGVQTGDSVTITLASRSALTIVVTHGGKPAQKVSLSCWGPVGTLGLEAEVDGKHTFTDVAQGEYRCEATGADGSAKASAIVRGEPVTLTMALDAFATVTGVAVNALTEQPVANILVMARGSSAKTGADGRFVLERAPAGTDEIVLMPDQLGGGVDKYPYTAKPGERVDLGHVKVVPPRTGDVGTFGLTLDIRGDAVVVAKVKTGSPAATAGIAVDDSIVALDGQAVTAVGLQRVQRFLTSENVAVGTVATLSMASGKRATITAVKW